uniref:Uncharacterized protein n=1 Tax=Panagrolaimus davidi TaxID=227884 RepID=A0A914Q1Z6_9BILA
MSSVEDFWNLSDKGINSQLLLLCVAITLERRFDIILFYLLYALYKSRNLKPEHFDPNLLFPQPPPPPPVNYMPESDTESDWDSDSNIESDVDSAFSSDIQAESEIEPEI